MFENHDLQFAAAIVLMTVATYFTRAGGLFIISRVTPSPRIRAFLDHMPASILVAIVVPTLIGKGPAELISAGATMLTALYTRSLTIAMLTGLISVSMLRALVFT